MSWEEDTLVEGIRHLLRPRTSTQAGAEAQRRRDKSMRQFLSVFGATHWAERVEPRRNPIARRGHIAL
jgi:hypothetical protein